MTDWQRVEYTDSYGVGHLVLVNDPNMPPEDGVPLLDLNGLSLPEDIEIALRRELWARGLKEYADILAPGKADVVGAALRSALRFAVAEIIEHCRREYGLLRSDK